MGERHLFGVHRPAPVAAEHLPVIGVGIGRPVLGIDEIRPFERFALVVFDAGIADELRGKLVAFGMGDDEVVAGGVHPLGE